MTAPGTEANSAIASPSTNTRVAKVNPWHQRLAEWLIVNGNQKGWNKAAAEAFGVSPPWISTVYHSDAFQDYFQRLSNAHSQALLVNVREKATATADAAISEVHRRIESAPESISIKDLLETTETMRKFSAPAVSGGGGGPQVTNNITLSVEDLEAARNSMRERALKSGAPRGAVLDLAAEPVLDGGSS